MTQVLQTFSTIRLNDLNPLIYCEVAYAIWSLLDIYSSVVDVNVKKTIILDRVLLM